MELTVATRQVSQHPDCVEERNEESRERQYSGIGPTGRQIGRNVARFRTEQRMTTDELARRLSEADVPIKASTVTKIENAQRRVTADELITIAVVLGVNVNALLLPVEIDRDRPIKVTGHGSVHAQDAWRWATGESPMPGHGIRNKDFQARVNPWWVLQKPHRDLTSPEDLQDAKQLMKDMAERGYGTFTDTPNTSQEGEHGRPDQDDHSR